MKAFAIVAGIVLLAVQAQCLPWLPKSRTLPIHRPQHGKNAQCDLILLNKCVAAAATTLGLTDLPESASQFGDILNDIIAKQGLDGMKLICKAEEDSFKNCLGAQYDSCITVQMLESIGLSEGDASGYVTISYELDYECTTGWDTIQQNWDCVYKVGTSSQQYFDQCGDTFGQEVSSDPSKFCQYEQELVGCVDKPFKDTCKQAVADVFCGALQAAYAPVWPQCSVTCPAL